MRILFIEMSTPVGGAERALCDLAGGLAGAGHRVDFVCLRRAGVLAGELGPLGVRLRDEVFARPFHVLRLVRFVAWARASAFDVVYTRNHPATLVTGWLASTCGRVPVRAAAFHEMGRPDGRRKRALALALYRPSLAIALADAQLGYLHSAYGLDPKSVAVIRNGVHTSRYARRGRHGAPRLRVGSIAVLRPEKRVDLFLRAAADLLATHQDAEFVVAGEGPRREELDRLRSELGLADAVEFLGHEPDTAGLLRSIDVLVVSSDREVSPLVIMEAMAAGVPVVATDVGGVRELVRDGVTGFLVPKGSWGAIAEALRGLASDRSRLLEMGRTARRLAREELDVSRTIELTERAMREALLGSG